MYFESHGKENTVNTLELAFTRGRELGLSEVVVASTTGETAYKTLDVFDGFNITAVTYHAGFHEPFKLSMSDETRKDLEKKGVAVVAATHALSGVERALSKKHQGSLPVLAMADTLRLFGQGTKVAVEVSIMAADAGVLTGNDIVAIGGSGKGADSALILKPAHAGTLFDMKIREVVCKPRSF